LTSDFVVMDEAPFERALGGSMGIGSVLTTAENTYPLFQTLAESGLKPYGIFTQAYESFTSVIKIFSGTLRDFSVIVTLAVIYLLFNFISASIRFSKRQIGILRALGAGKLDTFLVYVWEALLVGGISDFLAILVILVGGPIANNVFGGSYGYYFTVIQLPFLTLFRMLLLTFVIVALGLLVPLWRYNKITPIDAMTER
jgi:ABC-type antimicrobial peptide transport system permease subunit